MRKQDKRWRTDAALWEKLKPIAHEMRVEPTEAEKKLWKYLRKHQLQGEEDLIRQEYLESQPLKVLRFPNDTVLNDVNEVMKHIEAHLSSTL